MYICLIFIPSRFTIEILNFSPEFVEEEILKTVKINWQGPPDKNFTSELTKGTIVILTDKEY